MYTINNTILLHRESADEVSFGWDVAFNASSKRPWCSKNPETSLPIYVFVC